ncbi:MAG: hypothetical protein ACFFDW_05500 [Candidatus Thorarchaeota archaeon]
MLTMANIADIIEAERNKKEREKIKLKKAHLQENSCAGKVPLKVAS